MKDARINIEQLMVEKLLGTIEQKDVNYLNDLLEKDSEVRGLWEKMKNIYEKEGSAQFLESLDVAEAWGRLKNSLQQNDSKAIRPWMAIAASLMIPIFIAGIFYWKSSTPSVAKEPAAHKSVQLYVHGSKAINLSNNKAVSTSALSNVKLEIHDGSLSYIPLGEGNTALNTLVIPETVTYKLTLSDGTEVMLNSGSQLKFPFEFSTANREVWIEGEAYFKVSKDIHRPFIVHTPSTEIKVLGTEFNVNTYDSRTVKTSLVTGSIKTKSVNGKDSAQLEPGYEALFVDGKKFSIVSFDKDYKLSWMKGIYYFQNTSLTQIASMIRRCYSDSIVFDNPQIMSSRFTGAMFKDKPLKEFLDNLALTSKIRYNYKHGVIHLTLE